MISQGSVSCPVRWRLGGILQNDSSICLKCKELSFSGHVEKWLS